MSKTPEKSETSSVLMRLQQLDLTTTALDEPLLKRIPPDALSRLTEAAVLIPMTFEDRVEILFTKRAQNLRKHSGEMSFPGGRKDPEDASLLETALRETEEEIGLSPCSVEVFGCLLKMPTISNYIVHVFVGRYPKDHPLTVNRDEIDEIISIPLDALMDPSIHREGTRPLYGINARIDYYTYRNYTIWGVTGYMLNRFLHFLSL